MKTNNTTTTAKNIVNLPIARRTKRGSIKTKSRFVIQEFTNRGGSRSFRVSGYRRDGGRIRENFIDQQSAECRRIELEAEFHAGHTETAMRATKLSHEHIQLAEVAFIKLGDDWMRLLDCVDHWKKHGRHTANTEAPRIDEAVESFKQWLDSPQCTLREHSKNGPRLRVGVFANSLRNVRLDEITPDMIENFLAGLKVSPITADNYKRDVSGFLSWCMERPRRWLIANPCREIKVARAEKAPPAILTLDQCKALLRTAEKHDLAAYVAVSLFAGLRPFETSRLTWPQVNLVDREIRLEGNQTKTGKPRVITICDTLARWLKAYEGQEFFPSGWHKRFRKVKQEAGIATWPVDVMRHTAASHYFRKTGSYGETAEQLGNSEGIIKAHYQSRVSTDETKKFYAIQPKKGAK